MITIDDKTYTKDDLTEKQIGLVERVNVLQGELNQLQMRTQELDVIINAYANAIKEGFSEEK